MKTVFILQTKNVPPRTHNLIYLIDLTKVTLSQQLTDFIGIINDANVVTRYPQDLAKIVKSYSKEVPKQYLKKTEEIIECIKKMLK